MKKALGKPGTPPAWSRAARQQLVMFMLFFVQFLLLLKNPSKNGGI